MKSVFGLKNAGIDRQRGQSVVEIAISVPFLLILLLGVLEMGIVFATYLAVVNATREGAVFASMYPQLSDAACARSPQPACTGAHDGDAYGGGGTMPETIWTEYVNRISNESFVQPGEVLRADGLIKSGIFYVERPYAPAYTIGSPITVTVHYTITTLTSGMSFPFFGRLGLPNSYHIRYEFAMPIRSTQ